MARVADVGRKLWSWISPVPVQVRLVSRRLPTGQIEVHPEYSVVGATITNTDLNAGGLVRGYRCRVSSTVREIENEFQGKRLRLRPRAAGEWLHKYANRNVPVVDEDSGRRIEVFAAEGEFDLELHSNGSVQAKGYLSRPDGVEIDPAKARPVPNEQGWFELNESIFERPTFSPAMDDVIDAGDSGCTLTGDAIPDLIVDLETHKRGIRAIKKNKQLEDRTVFHGNPVDTLRVDGEDDKVTIDQGLAFSASNGLIHEERLAEAETVLASAGKSEAYKSLPNGWVRVRRSDTDKAKRAREALPGDAADKSDFRGIAIPELLSALAEEVRKGSPWNVYVSEKVTSTHRLVDEQALVKFKLSVVDVEGGESLLQADPLYQHQKQDLPHPEVADAVRRHDNWVRRPKSWVRIDKTKFAAVESAIRDQLHLRPREAGFTFPASQREQVLEALGRLGKIEQTESYAEFLRKLLEFNGIEHVDPPRALKADYTFRSYQQHGYNWLVFLRRFGLNGILADDMGLGKTLQTLSVIRHSKETNARGSDYPSLIICPVSVMANWEAEAKRFFPETRVARYRGNNRQQLLGKLYFTDLVITSYTIAANDFDALNSMPWNYVVIDEAHAIKNPRIQRSQRIKQIGGLHKLALTGTPVQNSVTDLWSLFDYLLPGYLGTHSVFRATYPMLFNTAETTFGDQSGKLQARVRPFVLRRLKQDVAKELPDKLVIDRPVELSKEQRRLYKELLEGREVKDLKASIARDDYRSQSFIFPMLTKLRLICNHPVLHTQKVEWTVAEASKLDSLQDLLAEVVEGGHRALIFSQFTKMLDLIQHCLPEWNVPFLRIDGSTPDSRRQGLVDTFNSDQSYSCMLLSTRAGGLGLNLTGADTVIFYDHDWNPANDEQAQDRAYRIGQTRNVTVYRLITKGTIEEKMLLYQTRKKALSQALVAVDEQGVKNLTREELIGLFTFEDSESTAGQEDE